MRSRSLRAEVADHGVSVTHEADFRDAVITLRFKLGAGDDLGINLADMNEKSVHAGHICVARIRPHQVEISDLKTGRMDLARRTRRLAGEETAADKARIKATSTTVDVDLYAQSMACVGGQGRGRSDGRCHRWEACGRVSFRGHLASNQESIAIVRQSKRMGG